MSKTKFQVNKHIKLNIKFETKRFELKYTLDMFNPLSANLTKWSNTLKQFVGNSQQIV